MICGRVDLERAHTAILEVNFWDAWVAQLVKRPTLDFGLGRDLVVHGTEPTSAMTAWRLLGIFSLPPPLSLSAFSWSQI